MAVISWLTDRIALIHSGCAINYQNVLEANEKLLRRAGDLHQEISVLKDDMASLQHEISAERRARVQAESHVNSLREQLDFTRTLLTEALAFERDGIKGLQYRLGLIPQMQAQTAADQKSVRTSTAPWSTVQRGLEKKSSELAKKDNDERAAHWTRKIKEVEKKDQEISGGSTAENAEIQRDLDDLNREESGAIPR